MKKFILSALLSTNIILLPDHHDENQIEDITRTIKNQNAHEEENGQQTTRAQSIKTWTEPLIINSKNYTSRLTFTENINYNPGKNYNYPYYYQNYPAAIIVDADNVVIDLAGFNLSLDPSSATSFLVNNPTFGIAITAGTQNVKIISSSATNSKGSISGFTGYAIYMQGSTYVANSYDMYQNYIKNIEVSNLSLSYNTSGIYANFGVLINIIDTDIVYNFSSRPVYGISFSTVLESNIKNTKINQNYSWNDITGIFLQDTINNFVENCEICHQQSLKNGNAIGVQLTATSPASSFVNIISKCVANTNLSSYTAGRESIGFLITGASHTNTISECKTLFNTHGPSFGSPPPLTNPKGYGIKLGTTANNQITKNTSAYHSDYGFFDASPVSTSFFSNNVAMFNIVDNYVVTIPTGSGSEPLPVVIIYQDTLDTYTALNLPTFGNLSILPGGA